MLQAAHLTVEIAQAGGDAGEMTVPHEGGVGHVDRRLDRVGEALEAAVVASRFSEFEKPPLGILDLLGGGHVDRGVIGDVDHVLADRDQRPPRGEVVDGPSVVRGIDDCHRFAASVPIVRHGNVAVLFVGRQKVIDGQRLPSCPCG